MWRGAQRFWQHRKVRPAGAVGGVSARKKDGTEFPVEVGLNPIQTPHGILVLATVADISAAQSLPKKRHGASASKSIFLPESACSEK